MYDSGGKRRLRYGISWGLCHHEVAFLCRNKAQYVPKDLIKYVTSQSSVRDWKKTHYTKYEALRMFIPHGTYKDDPNQHGVGGEVDSR